MRGRKESRKTAETQVLTIAGEGLLSRFLRLSGYFCCCFCCCCRSRVCRWDRGKTRMTPAKGTHSLSPCQPVCALLGNEAVCAESRWTTRNNQLSRDTSAAFLLFVFPALTCASLMCFQILSGVAFSSSDPESLTSFCSNTGEKKENLPWGSYEGFFLYNMFWSEASLWFRRLNKWCGTGRPVWKQVKAGGGGGQRRLG